MKTHDPLIAELTHELENRGGLLNGHFRLSSGRHSARFVQKFRLLEDPRLVEIAVRALLAEFARVASGGAAFAPTVVVSAAIGGIVLGYEAARQLGVRAIFVEKADGKPVFRRGFTLDPTDRVLVVEDVVTTGLSLREVIAEVETAGAAVAGVGIIVRRAPITFDAPTAVLLEMPLESFDPAECPLCADAQPMEDPGSRRSAA